MVAELPCSCGSGSGRERGAEQLYKELMAPQGLRCPHPNLHAGQHWLQISSEASTPALTPILPGCQEPQIIPSASPTSTLSSGSRERFIRRDLKDKSSYIYLWPGPQTWAGGLQAAGAVGAVGAVGVGEGMPDLLAEGSLHHCPESPAPSGGCLHPPGHTQSTWGRGKEIRHSPRKSICLEAVLGSGDTPDQIPVLAGKRSWPSFPRDPSTATTPTPSQGLP